MLDKEFTGSTKVEAFDKAFSFIEDLIVNNDVNCSVLRHITDTNHDVIYFRLNTTRMANNKICRLAVKWGSQYDTKST